MKEKMKRFRNWLNKVDPASIAQLYRSLNGPIYSDDNGMFDYVAAQQQKGVF